MLILASRLKQAMELRHMNASELSKKTNIAKSSLSGYLNSNFSPGSKKVIKMAEVLRVNPSWLLGDDCPMELEAEYFEPDAAAIEEIKNRPILCSLIETSKILSDKQIEQVIKIMKVLGDD